MTYLTKTQLNIWCCKKFFVPSHLEMRERVVSVWMQHALFLKQDNKMNQSEELLNRIRVLEHENSVLQQTINELQEYQPFYQPSNGIIGFQTSPMGCIVEQVPGTSSTQK